MTGKETREKNGAGKTGSEGPKSIGKPGPKVAEIGGRDGPEPTRYGDWEVKGICSDF